MRWLEPFITTSVEEARYFLDQMNKEIRKDIEEEAGDRMDPMGQQMEGDDEDNGMEEHDDYQHCNPENIALDVDKEKNMDTAYMFLTVERKMYHCNAFEQLSLESAWGPCRIIAK